MTQQDGTQLRLEALRLAVDLYKYQSPFDGEADAVLHAYGVFAELLTDRAARLTVGRPVIAEQASPAIRWPAPRDGDNMAVTMTDTQQATYPATSETDSKGFPVTGDTITVAESSGGTVVAMTQNADGSTTFAAVAPGSAQVSWTDGTLSYADTVNVTSGPAATLVVGQPTIEDQAAASSSTSDTTAAGASTGSTSDTSDSAAATADPSSSSAPASS